MPTATAEDPSRSERCLKTRLTRDLSGAALRFDPAPRRSPSACPENLLKIGAEPDARPPGSSVRRRHAPRKRRRARALQPSNSSLHLLLPGRLPQGRHDLLYRAITIEGHNYIGRLPHGRHDLLACLGVADDTWPCVSPPLRFRFYTLEAETIWAERPYFFLPFFYHTKPAFDPLRDMVKKS